MAERRQHLRQWLLLRMLSTRTRGLTLKEMASETGMGERTIRRDLIDLQSVGFPLAEAVSDHGRKHWRLTDAARRAVIAGFERRLDQEITHPLFGYKISYRRVLEVQGRLLARTLLGELPEYPNFCTR